MKRNIISVAALIFATVCLLIIAIYVKKSSDTDEGGSNNYIAGEYTQYDFVMGTYMTQTIYGDDSQENLNETAEKIASEISALDEDCLSWRSDTSTVAKLNNEYIAGENYDLDLRTGNVIKKALDICKTSEGALDITMRPLIACWGIEQYDSVSGEEFTVPSFEELEEAKSHTGYEKVNLITEEDAGNIKYYINISESGLGIDLGAVGKGAALDTAYETLEEEGISGALISVGGSIMAYGKKGDGSDFRIGIRNPEGDANDVMGYVEIAGNDGQKVCVSTSGGYEKYVEADGEVYHHILDRETMYPSDSGLISVTVICSDGLTSDGLSTACFVLGYEKSLEILPEYDAEAIFIDDNHNVYVTNGIYDNFVLTDDTYNIKN